MTVMRASSMERPHHAFAGASAGVENDNGKQGGRSLTIALLLGLLQASLASGTGRFEAQDI